MKSFSIGYNGDLPGFKQVVQKFTKHLGSVYFPIIDFFQESTVSTYSGKSITKEEILTLVGLCKENSIESLLLLNNIDFDFNKFDTLIDYIHELNKAGLSSIVVTNPIIIRRLKEALPEQLLEGSVMLNVTTLSAVNVLKNIGISRLCFSVFALKDLDFIDKARKVMPLKIMVNLACIPNCPHFCLHMNEETRYSDFGELVSNSIKGKEYYALSTAFVRPEDLHHYHRFHCEYKLATRSCSSDRIERILKAYIDEKYEGNLLDILVCCFGKRVPFIDNTKLNRHDFFNSLISCDNNCGQCTFCKEVFQAVK